ncbi:hypothetical protein [Sporosarcina ureilytica]|uniref:Endonuclease IV n=1 Tax=Sporosarcina ureilytica TaxID=298596 RepID=A0A1D8JGL7_9BACL|nr:hypothetical protein [Sporosarcina ureilytica]AOV07869.1 hypothetical protein BI350_10200 [Sporosarcina ureilytica]
MDFVQFLNEVKMSSDREVQSIASSYGVDFSISEIRALRPLLDDISFHWIFTGIPDSFVYKVQQVIGASKTDDLLKMYINATRR